MWEEEKTDIGRLNEQININKKYFYVGLDTSKPNEGKVPQYYVEGSHDAIIDPAEWQLVQTEIQRRKNTRRSHNCCSPFSAKLKCGDCGEFFGSKVWHSNSKYKRMVWQCNAKFKGRSRWTTPHLYEQRIKELFLEVFGILMENRETIIGDCRAVMEVLTDCCSIDTEMKAVSDEMEVTARLIQKLVNENATRKLDQHDYRKKYDGYVNRYAALESRMDSLGKERAGSGNFRISCPLFLRMAICEKLRYNFDVESVRKLEVL